MREQTVLEPREKYEWKFESFGGVQSHHLNTVFPGFGLTLARLEYCVCEKRLERRQLFAVDSLRLKAARSGDEFE